MAKFARFENEVINLDYVTALEKDSEMKRDFGIDYLIKFHMINGDIPKLRYANKEERDQEFETIYSILRG